MGDILKQRLGEDFGEVFIISGIAKDSAIDYLEEDLKSASERGIKIHICVGVDRKNTSKDVLLKVLNLGANLSINVNGDTSKVETRLYVFKSDNKPSYIYISGGKFSEGGLVENTCLITEICYETEDKELFTRFLKQMEEALAIFKNADKDDIALLAMKGEIVSRIIDRKIPSISELYGDKEQVIGEQVYDEGVGLGMIHQDDLEDFEIEFDEGISLRKNVEMEAEKEAKIDAFAETNKTEEDLDRLLGKEKAQKEVKKSRIVKDLKESDFKAMTSLIMEVGKLTDQEMKIPKNLAMFLGEFLPFSDAMSMEVIDNRDNQSKNMTVEIKDNGKGISLISEEMEKLGLADADIVRIMKLSATQYRLEIIREGSNEYAIWERYLTNTIKGTKRRFGIE